MPLIAAPTAIVRAAIDRAVKLNLTVGAVTRALNRAGYSVRGIGVPARVRTGVARQTQREVIEGLHGNAKPSLGRGMTARPIQALTRYSYVGQIVYRLPDGSRTTKVQTVLSNERLTKAGAGRLLLSQAEQMRALGRQTRSGVAEINAVPESATLTEAFANQI